MLSLANMRWVDWMVWHDCDSSADRPGRSLDFTQRGSTPARRLNEPVMQSRACCHWLLLTSSPLSSFCSEQAPHVACRLPRPTRRSCSAFGIRTRLRPHISLFAEKGSCVGSCLSSCCASYSSEVSPTASQPCPYQYRVPRTACPFLRRAFRRCSR